MPVLDNATSERAEPVQRFARLRSMAGPASVAVLLLLGLWTVRSFLPALVWAAILGIALWPLYRRIERSWPPRHRSVLLPAIFTGLIALAVVLPLVLAVWQGAREAHDLLQWAREIEKSGVPAPEWLGALPFGAEQAAKWWRENLSEPGDPSELLRQLNRGSLLMLTRGLGLQVVHRIVLFAFTLFALFFIFRDGRALRVQMLAASHRLFGPRGERVARHMAASVHGTVNGLVLVGLGEGLLLGIAYIAAGVPHPVLLGTLTAIAAMIPLGAPLMFAIGALLLLGQGAAVAAGAIVVFGLVVVGIADHVVRPLLIGGATRLPFLWVLVGIFGGVETWGLFGLFLGPALMAALMLLWRELTEDTDPVPPLEAPVTLPP
jgi:predicted PurR-regulated permease PerM